MNNKGASLVFTTVLLMVFILIGSTLLPAAYSASAGVTQREKELQCYYYSRSLLDILDDSLRNGELQQLVFDKAFETLGEGNEHTFTFELTPDVSFETPTDIPAPTYSEVKIAVLGRLQILERTAENTPSECYMSIQSLEFSFVSEYYEEKYAMRAGYVFSGFGTIENGAWRWNGTWENLSVSKG